ncbi:MAG: histidinol-phosphate transaminase [Intrasporangium sp.]|uniref:histidinol-phosphate transaminase n=1 Tax=Intrasporangium sp. TaxID=1925024 RepID=UPI00264899A3|nr:histidinol-phosphate transaminase [Intrasporangium sp.]MDN5797582.1 histidinol-phosphate transaminase [Intrasporangium sp.]
MTHQHLQLLRNDLGLLPRYVAGRPPRASAGWKLSSNEIAVPPCDDVMLAARGALASANRYPDITATTLVQRLASHLTVDAEHIVVGGGSIAVLQELLQTVTDPGDRVVFAWRSYEAYPIVTRVSRATPVEVPLLADHRHDLAAMAEAVRRHGARVVIVCNPNNPTGTAVTRPELESFLEAVPTRCLVILDEAYREFVTDDAVPDGLELARDRPNVVVLRTFSKAHGLAGLRVGYAVAPSWLADGVRAVSLPFTVSSVAQAAAVAALEAWPKQREIVGEIVCRRDEFVAVLHARGVEATPSQANFVWLPWSPVVVALVEACSDLGISVRRFGKEGVRITIGEPEALAAISTALPLGAAR